LAAGTGHSGVVKSAHARKPTAVRRAVRARPAKLPAVSRIVMADNDSLYRIALRQMLAGVYPQASIAEAHSRETLEAALAAQPAELALIDLGLPGLNGYLSIMTLVQRYPRTRFIAISGLEPPLAAQRVLALGMTAFISKRATQERLMRVVASTRRPPYRLPPREKKLVEGLHRLTPTETLVFTLLPDNPSHRSIMEALDIALPTVKTHMSRILSKLGLRHRTEAAIVAQRLSLFDARTLYIEGSVGRER
jgi:two-component system NarL family response regulator